MQKTTKMEEEMREDFLKSSKRKFKFKTPYNHGLDTRGFSPSAFKNGMFSAILQVKQRDMLKGSYYCGWVEINHHTADDFYKLQMYLLKEQFEAQNVETKGAEAES